MIEAAYHIRGIRFSQSVVTKRPGLPYAFKGGFNPPFIPDMKILVSIGLLLISIPCLRAEASHPRFHLITHDKMRWNIIGCFGFLFPGTTGIEAIDLAS